MTLLKDKKKIISLLFYEERHIDELFVDYLERLAHFNGFARTAHFIDLLRGTFAHLYFFNFDKKPDENAHLSDKPNAFTRCVYAIEYLTKSFPVPNEEFQLQEQEYIYYKNRTRGDGSAEHPLDLPLFRYELCVKVCTKCWNEKEYFRFYWRFNDYVICHIHKDSLESYTGQLYRNKFSLTKAEIDSVKINYDKANLTANALQSLPNEHHTLLKVTEERIIQFSLKEIHRIILHYLVNYSIEKNDQIRQLKNADSIILSQCTAAKRLDLICQHISNENGIILEKVCTIAFFCIFFKFSEFRNINGIHSWITAISFSIDQELSKLAYPKGVSVYETLKNTPKYTLEETDKSLLRIINNYFLGLPLRF